MTKKRLRKNVAVGTVALLLAALGIHNIVLKASFRLLDDGVFWKHAPEGVVAARVAASGPGARAGLQAGDILLALDGDEVLSAADVEAALGRRHSGEIVRYQILRAEEKRALEVTVGRCPRAT